MTAPVLVENRTYDEIEIGESASLSRTITQDDIELFAAVSGAMPNAGMPSPASRPDAALSSLTASDTVSGRARTHR